MICNCTTNQPSKPLSKSFWKEKSEMLRQVHKQRTAHDLVQIYVDDLINPFKVARTDESQVIDNGS